MISIMSICDSSLGMYIIAYAKIAIRIITIVVPIILIISLMISAVRAISSNDSDLISKLLKSWTAKAIAAILIFLIPTFVYTIEGFVTSGTNSEACIKNATIEKAKNLRQSEENRKKQEMQNWQNSRK